MRQRATAMSSRAPRPASVTSFASRRAHSTRSAAAARVERVDLVKIDVEGFEWPVLKGAEQTISRFRPHIVFEYLVEYAGRGGGTPQLLDDFFARHRYLLFALGRRGRKSRASRPLALRRQPVGRPAIDGRRSDESIMIAAAVRSIRNRLRDLVYPGLDLHTRNRASLRRYWKPGPRDVLDAGSGNGYFAWLAYASGARVVAMNFEQAQVDKAREFLTGLSKGRCEASAPSNSATSTI